MIQLKKVDAIQASDTAIQLKKGDENTKTDEIEKEILDHDHSKYITHKNLRS